MLRASVSLFARGSATVRLRPPPPRQAAPFRLASKRWAGTPLHEPCFALNTPCVARSLASGCAAVAPPTTLRVHAAGVHTREASNADLRMGFASKMKEWNRRGDYEHAICAYQMLSQYPKSAEAHREYELAKKMLGLSDPADPLRGAEGGGGAREGASHMTADGPILPAGTKENPLIVKTSDGTSIWWRIIKGLMFAMVVVYGGSFIMKSMSGNAQLGGREGIGGMLFSDVGQEGKRQDVRFKDVLGIDEVKEELTELVHFLKDPRRYSEMGARLPAGVLLHGPPGTGKTLLAKAVSGEAGVPFFFVSGSEFDEVFVGLGAKRVRKIFEQAKAAAPCIIFIDEIDSLGSSRTRGFVSGRDGTLNQLLTCMDGFNKEAGVIVIGATNMLENMDDALLRPGRFDKKIAVHPPDLEGRKQILQLYLGKIKYVAKDVNIDLLGKSTMGATGADLANMVNLAAIKAVRGGVGEVTQRLLEESLDDVIMGPERKSMVLSKEGRRATAYHEAGHALVSALYHDKASPVRKITIVPRGQSLGVTIYGQKNERAESSRNKEEMKAMLATALGGRAAEELIYGEGNVSTGASSDFRTAKRTAHAMVTKYGMSDAIGKVFFDKDEELSEETRNLIDREVRKLINEHYDIALNLLKKNKDKLDRITNALLEYETISGDEMLMLMEGKKLTRAKPTLREFKD